MTTKRMRRMTGQLVFSGIAAAALTVAPVGHADPAAGTLAVEQAGDLGSILVDSTGKTVYAFEGDTADSSACQAACLQNWPIVVASDPLPMTPFGAVGQLGVFVRPDGTRQLTLDSHQLYTFAKDTAAGQHNRVGKELNGSRWGVVEAIGGPRY
jgi:predicted lipoprotein with Yx(FWY)xxD motif